MSLGASEPLEAVVKLCLLVSRPMHDLVGKVAGNAVPKGQRQGSPRASVARGLSSYARALVGIINEA